MNCNSYIDYKRECLECTSSLHYETASLNSYLNNNVEDIHSGFIMYSVQMTNTFFFLHHTITLFKKHSENNSVELTNFNMKMLSACKSALSKVKIYIIVNIKREHFQHPLYHMHDMYSCVECEDRIISAS